MIKSALKIVCDSGPIIHLDELNCLHLLEDFQEILLPDTVYKEIKRYRPLNFKNSNLPFVLSAGTIPNDSTLITLCSIFSLDVGETEALALMEKNPQAIFLTDDASARMVAEQMGLKVLEQLVSLSDPYGEVNWNPERHYVFSKEYHPKALCI
jgi:predicted nucleic acid-binding protein